MTRWSGNDWAVLLGSVAAVVTALTAAAVNLINAIRGVSNKVDALEVKVDGRLTQLLEQTAAASSASGRELGRGEMVINVPVPEPIIATFDGEKIVVPVPENPPPVLIVPTAPAAGSETDVAPAIITDYPAITKEKEL